MGFIALKCQSCGADIELDDSREFGFCQYCGTKIVQEKQIVEHRGTIKVKVNGGGPTANSLLERADIFLSREHFADAERYCNRVLDIDPRCAEAYWGLLKCDLQVTSDNALRSLPEPFSDLENYSLAIEFADDMLREYYTSVNQAIIDRLEEEERIRQEEEKIRKEDENAKEAVWHLLIVIVLLLLCIIITGLIGNRELFPFSGLLSLVLIYKGILCWEPIQIVLKRDAHSKHDQSSK